MKSGYLRFCNVVRLIIAIILIVSSISLIAMVCLGHVLFYLLFHFIDGLLRVLDAASLLVFLFYGAICGFIEYKIRTKNIPKRKLSIFDVFIIISLFIQVAFFSLYAKTNLQLFQITAIVFMAIGALYVALVVFEICICKKLSQQTDVLEAPKHEVDAMNDEHRYCRYCGKKIDKDHKFCIHCGNNLE